MHPKQLARIMLLTFLLTFGLIWLVFEVFRNDQALIQRCRDQAPPPSTCSAWQFKHIAFNATHTEAHVVFWDGNSYDCRVRFDGLRWTVMDRFTTLAACLSP
jgi:hypothetical protein